MKNAGKLIHLQSYITKRLDALDEVNSDKFSEDEKQLINNAFDKMVNDIRNNRFPYKTQLQRHFPGVEFWYFLSFSSEYSIECSGRCPGIIIHETGTDQVFRSCKTLV